MFDFKTLLKINMFLKIKPILLFNLYVKCHISNLLSMTEKQANIYIKMKKFILNNNK